jgi:hypothetical protein
VVALASKFRVVNFGPKRSRSKQKELIPESQQDGNTNLATMGAMIGFLVLVVLDVAFYSSPLTKLLFLWQDFRLDVSADGWSLLLTISVLMDTCLGAHVQLLYTAGVRDR